MKGANMAEVTKEDMNRVFDKIEEVGKVTNKTDKTVAVIQTKLEAHLKSHTRWSGPIVRAVIDIVKIGVVAGVVFVIAKK